MDSLEIFKTLTKRDVEIKPENKYVLVYTRVSSKEQFDNYSLNNQKDAAEKYAKENGYIISEYFGGTYESASGDFTRKEFKRLIEEVKKARVKPFAILIFIMSRFSRSGGNGISYAVELVEGLNVNLIEISSGENTITERGKLAVYNKLLKAREETLNKLDVSIPGMKSFLKAGNWLGNVPRGYDHYGPRVKDYSMHRANQEIVINKEGKLLMKAWEWKLLGEQDYIIRDRLQALGLNIRKQQLSSMWRCPFYAGVVMNKMLGDVVVPGKWEKMISHEGFFQINEMLKNRVSLGYKQDKSNPARPLSRHIHCSACGGKLVGYEVKEKRLHYYKCVQCKGVSINANTTKKSLGKGAHDMFADLLNGYVLDEVLVEPFKKQLAKTFDSANTNRGDEEKHLNDQLLKSKTELKNLKRHWAVEGKIDDETYKEFKAEIDKRIFELESNLKKRGHDSSNLLKYIDNSVDVARNISKYWHSGDLDTKRRIQKLVFPQGLTVNIPKREYLTTKVNSVFSLINGLARVTEDEKKDDSVFFSESSVAVAGLGLEPRTFGL
jgi:site-specific DNA recombinase